MDEEKKIVISAVQTPQCCFITDLIEYDGYSVSYHRSELSKLFFDGEKAEPTFAANWMRIKHVPGKIEILSPVKAINMRYELIDSEMASDKLPGVILYEDRGKYPENVIENLYRYDRDLVPQVLIPANVEFKLVMKLEDYEEPSVKFEAIGKFGYGDKVYTIESRDIEHQLLDKMIFPEVCLSNRPCYLTSRQVYNITRQHILNNIDPSVAKIAANYDYCFSVKKIIPKIEPETVTYQNLFARTKKERSKIKTAVINFNEYEIFQMTHDERNYDRYTPVGRIVANNEKELQDKVSEWLDDVMAIINAKVKECPYCKGTGLTGDVAYIATNVICNASFKDEAK